MSSFSSLSSSYILTNSKLLFIVGSSCFSVDGAGEVDIIDVFTLDDPNRERPKRLSHRYLTNSRRPITELVFPLGDIDTDDLSTEFLLY